MSSRSVRALQLLSLAPTPTFALLGLLSATQESSLQQMVCSAGHSMSPLTGMAAMYLLMSVFHCAPWLRTLAGVANWLRPVYRRNAAPADRGM